MDMINFDGLLIGIATFLIIGLFHPVVVKAEYYWGTKCWWIFLVLGIVGTVASLLIESVFVSAICGVFAFSSFWTIKEVFEQTPPELVGDILTNGIVLTGGGAMLNGFPELVTEAVGAPCYVADDPIECVAKGVAKAFDYTDELLDGFEKISLYRYK